MQSEAMDRWMQVIVQARKPDFFNYNMSLYEVVTDDGLMRPVMKARKVCHGRLISRPNSAVS